ncbi:MAG: Alanine--tRNA ligase [Microgenomates bacterium OLB23]|nr:MAG: Alanine--tRNA ligase [Microgenomates bacterium OLB23]
MFASDVFAGIITEIQERTGKEYDDESNKAPMRIIADHIRAAVYLIHDGVVPSNKEHGYVLRRLLRRSAVKMWQLGDGLTPSFDSIIDRGVLQGMEELGVLNRSNAREGIIDIVRKEIDRFGASMDRGLKIIEKAHTIDGKVAFELYQSYGFPFEVTEELARQKGIVINKHEFEAELTAHKALSKTTSAGKFKGGLADQSDQVLKYHTATHLLHKALKDTYGNIIRQEGSNITRERMRFDTRLDHKPTPEEIKKVEGIVNEKIAESLPVYMLQMSKEASEKIGAAAFFKEKYGNVVQVYCIGGSESNPESAYSIELCGGPHVKNNK